MKSNIPRSLNRCLRSLLLTYFRYALFMLLFAISPICMAEEFDGDLQLFFSSNEPIDAKLDPARKSQAVQQLAQKNVHVPLAKAEDTFAVSPVSLKISQPKEAYLTFNAVVHTGRSISLLINDLPCEVLTLVGAIKVSITKDVLCAHLTFPDYKYKYHVHKQALQILIDNKNIAMLLVGQSL